MSQGNVLVSVLYLPNTSFLQQTEEATVATFSDGTAIKALGDSVEKATEKLQSAGDK